MQRGRDAESKFADYLRRVEEEGAVDFEAWVATHADSEVELRLLYEDWRALGSPSQAIEAPSASIFFQGRERDRPQAHTGLEPGAAVGEFRLVALIGQGGMGQVWEAAQTTLGDRRVAIKFVRPDRVTARQLDLFQREARAGGRLSHPGIVALFGYGESEGRAWIAMEYVDGCWTLRDSLDEMAALETLPAGYDRGVASFVAKAADAVHAAHAAGVIHRDLKPQNILVTREDEPKITDFGLARITDESELSRTGEFAGTYFYMSPEQVAARRAGIDHRTDVFSLGAVLYEMLTLRKPFEGSTTHEVAAQILAKDPVDPRTVRPRIPGDLVVIAAKAMEKDRDERYATLSELADDLRRFLDDRPILARAPTLWRRSAKWLKRNRKVVGAFAGALLLAVVAYGVGEHRNMPLLLAPVGPIRIPPESRAEPATAAEPAQRSLLGAAKGLMNEFLQEETLLSRLAGETPLIPLVMLPTENYTNVRDLPLQLLEGEVRSQALSSGIFRLVGFYRLDDLSSAMRSGMPLLDQTTGSVGSLKVPELALGFAIRNERSDLFRCHITVYETESASIVWEKLSDPFSEY